MGKETEDKEKILTEDEMEKIGGGFGKSIPKTVRTIDQIGYKYSGGKKVMIKKTGQTGTVIAGLVGRVTGAEGYVPCYEIRLDDSGAMGVFAEHNLKAVR